VLLSRTTGELVAGSGVELHPCGAVSLRGVPGQWTLFICVGAVGAVRTPARAVAPHRPPRRAGAGRR
jgi:hypothetical protein